MSDTSPSGLARRALLGLVAVLALAGCGGNVGSGDEQSGEGRVAPTQLRLAVGGESDEGFDPTLGWGRYGSPLFQSTLLKRDADLAIAHDLAIGYEVSADGLTWTVDIRTDAVFSDGEPLTSSDVAYTFNTAAKQGGLTDVTALRKAVAVDDDTVQFRLREPRSTFVNRLASLGIVPEHAHDASYAQRPVGSGPFKFVSWEKGQQLVVERNQDYYGEVPAFEQVVFLFTDEAATLAAAQSGEVHLASVPSAMATQEIDGMRLEAVPSIDNRGISFPTVPTGMASPAGHPVGNDVTADRAIREAVNLAVDRDELVDGILEGFGSPATGPANGTPWNNATAIADGDPVAAAAVLAEAGWRDSDGDQIVEMGQARAEFTLLYPAEDTIRQGLALAVVDMVAPVGIEINAEGVSWEEIEQRMHQDAVLFGWGSHDPTEMYNLYHSELAGIEMYNPGFYQDPAVDRSLDRAMAARSDEAANRQWRAAQSSAGGGFNQDYPWAWLVNLDHTYFVDDCLDLGQLQTEPHGHGWPITQGVAEWRWAC